VPQHGIGNTKTFVMRDDVSLAKTQRRRQKHTTTISKKSNLAEKNVSKNDITQIRVSRRELVNGLKSGRRVIENMSIHTPAITVESAEKSQKWVIA
jgi:hypothetical protein